MCRHYSQRECAAFVLPQCCRLPRCCVHRTKILSGGVFAKYGGSSSGSVSLVTYVSVGFRFGVAATQLIDCGEKPACRRVLLPFCFSSFRQVPFLLLSFHFFLTFSPGFVSQPPADITCVTGDSARDWSCLAVRACVRACVLRTFRNHQNTSDNQTAQANTLCGGSAA